MRTTWTTLFPIFIVIVVICSCNPQKETNNTNDEGIFRMITEGRIATDGGLTRGVAWADYDEDGDPDLYVSNSNGQWNALYRNDGDKGFRKVTSPGIPASPTVIHGGNSQGVNWVDYDNDGDLDLFVVSRGTEPHLLFLNEGNAKYVRIRDHALTAPGFSASMACWADMDKDGDLDVFLAGYDYPNLLFKNVGDGQFERIFDSPVTTDVEGRTRACSCGDANNDGLPEIYVANARIPNLYFENLGDWQFKQLESGHMVEDVGYSYGTSWADYDDDGDMDLFVANFDKENFLYQNDGTSQFTPVTEGIIATETGGASKGHSWGDYDNDGDLDLYIANGTFRPDMRNFLYLNNGDGSFENDQRGVIQMHADTSAGTAHADFDRDGDLDLFVANWGSRDEVNKFYENVGADGNWITIRLTSTISNSYGIGARIELFTSLEDSSKKQYRWMYPTTGYASQNDYELHFGLGSEDKIESMIIHWPSGIMNVHTNVAINTHWMAKEGGGLTEVN